MNMLKMPIYMPIWSLGTELDSMAYGMERMEPHATPMHAKHHFNCAALSGFSCSIQAKPSPPIARETPCTKRRLMEYRLV